MDCLTCGHRLLNVRESHFFSHVAYDVCDQCGGMWLDRGELDKLAFQTPGSVELSSVEMAEKDSAPTPQHFPPSCLRCKDRKMAKMHFMGEARILLSHCDACGGLWVDGGELAKINQYIHWFDKKAKPSKFGRFLYHAHASFFHRIDVSVPEPAAAGGLPPPVRPHAG